MENHLRGGLSAAGVLALVGALFGPLSPAAAAPVLDCVGVATCAEQFDFTGSPVFWTVPNGVDEITLKVAAGSGGKYRATPQVSSGGVVWDTVAVDPGEELAFIVGDRGKNDEKYGHEDNLGYGEGGFGGGGNVQAVGSRGGGGGGGSFVFIKSSGGTWQPLLVAGGGGGEGYWNIGGDGGFSHGSPNGGKASTSIFPGATTGQAGYPGGNRTTFDGVNFTPGWGELSASGTIGFGGGGGGYYGGAVGGGGSGFASARVASPETAQNFGPGYITVSFSKDQFSEVGLEVEAGNPVVGESVTLTGTLTQYDVPLSGGKLTFTAFLDGVQKFSQDLDVVTLDLGPGPFQGAAQTAFIPEVAGDYTFALAFTASDGDEHWDAVASEVMLTVGAAPPTGDAADGADGDGDGAEDGEGAEGGEGTEGGAGTEGGEGTEGAEGGEGGAGTEGGEGTEGADGTDGGDRTDSAGGGERDDGTESDETTHGAPGSETAHPGELAKTGTNGPGASEFVAFGALILGAGAILTLRRHRARP